MDMGRMPLVCDEIVPAMREYCTERNYDCEGCIFSVKKHLKDPPKSLDCIFANMPRDWLTRSEI